MFAKIKQIFAPKNKDIRKRIGYTIFALFIFILGTSIKVPGTGDITGDLGFLELLNVMGGGALKNFSIFALGVTPYITASIVIELLTMDIVPYLSELSKQGHTGRQKINQITRYVGIIFAFIQGYAMSFAFLGKTATTIDYLKVATILTAGTAFLLWLGDQITQKGIGNGISLLIMAGIIASLPTMFITAFNSLVVLGGSNQELVLGIVKFSGFVLVYLAIIVGVIFVQEAERRVPIQYANKSTASFGKQPFMPIKLNSAGVIPVIFASTLLSIPATVAKFINKEAFTLFVEKYLSFTTPVGFAIYVVFIFLFGYFYTFMHLKPEDLSKNLQTNGGYIPGIKPGKETEKYFKKVIARLTVVGTLFLIIIASLPIAINQFTSLPTTVTVGGTGLLIVVGVALETYKQLDSSLTTRNYTNSNTYRRGRR